MTLSLTVADSLATQALRRPSCACKIKVTLVLEQLGRTVAGEELAAIVVVVGDGAAAGAVVVVVCGGAGGRTVVVGHGSSAAVVVVVGVEEVASVVVVVIVVVWPRHTHSSIALNRVIFSVTLHSRMEDRLLAYRSSRQCACKRLANPCPRNPAMSEQEERSVLRPPLLLLLLLLLLTVCSTQKQFRSLH